MQRIRYTKANIFTSGEVRLMPGLNRVDDAKYEAVKDLPGFKNRVARGVIIVLPSLAAPATATAPGETPAVDPTLAEDILEMSDVLELRKLAKSKDPEVSKAAEMRLAEIDAAEKNADGEKGKGKGAHKGDK